MPGSARKIACVFVVLLIACATALSSSASATTVSIKQPPAPLGSAQYIQQAYGLTALSATSGFGDTIGIVDEAAGYSTLESDLAQFRADSGLPPCTIASGCLRVVNQDGEAGIVGQSSPGWRGETALDVQAVSALCPNCHILVVQAAGVFMGPAEATAYRLGADQISNSFGGPPINNEVYAFNGTASVAASGDDGYVQRAHSCCLTPADLSDVTAAGGTSLQPAETATARGVIETAWSYSGSSCSYRPQPIWQRSSNGGCSTRAVSDVSAVADPSTGLIIYCSGCDSEPEGPMETYMYGGTSLSSPLIAAFYGLVARQQLGDGGAGWAYRSHTFLNDITTGDNGECSLLLSSLCRSQDGYDGPTGNGSIWSAVVPGAPGVSRGQGCFCLGDPGSYVLSSTDTSVTLSGGVFPNRLPTRYWWAYGPTAALGQTTAPVEVGAGAEPVLVQDSIADLDPEVDYHFALFAENAMGTVSYGGDDGFTINARQRTELSPPKSAAPQTTVLYAADSARHQIKLRLHRKTADAKLYFVADTTRAHFQCSINNSKFQRCSSPVSYRVRPGHYLLRVRATDAGRTGPADSWPFQVLSQDAGRPADRRPGRRQLILHSQRGQRISLAR